MTAPVLTHLLDSLTVEPLFTRRTQPPTPYLAQRSGHHAVSGKYRDRPRSAPDRIEVSHLWSQLLELLPQGVIVVSRALKPVYWNRKAKHLCQVLAGGNGAEGMLPLAISEACHGVIRDAKAFHSVLMVECQTSTGHSVRISASLLDLTSSHEVLRTCPTAAEPASKNVPTFIAVFVENCDEVMQQESRIQQQKYDLTDREAEVWMLLRQEFTYQEIAQRLQISLNTVKTHVKNVYAKRRSGQGKEKFWY